MQPRWLCLAETLVLQASRSLASTMDQSNDAYKLALTIHESYPLLDQIRIYVLTDRQAKAKNFIALKMMALAIMPL